MKRLLPFVILVIILMMGLAAVPILVRPEKHRAEITDALAKLTQRRVLLGPLSMAYFPPTLLIEQIAVMKDADNPILQVGSVVAPLDWKALLQLKLVPKRIRLYRWVLTVRRRPDGRWDTRDWFPGASGLSAASAWPLEDVRWIEGEIRWIDEYAAIPNELTLTTVQGNWDPKKELLQTTGTFQAGASTRVNFSAKGKFFKSPQWSGALELTSPSNQRAAFHLEVRPDILEIRGQSPQWPLANSIAFFRFFSRIAMGSLASWGPWILENWQFHWREDPQQTVLEQKAGLSGGQTEFQATLKPQNNGLLMRAGGAVKNIPLQAVLNLTGENLPLEGSLTGVVKDVEVILSSRSWSSLKGQGSWGLANGNYRVPKVSLNKLQKAKLMKYVQKKFPTLTVKGFPLSKLRVDWQAKNGMVSILGASLSSADLRAAFAGTVDATRKGLDGLVSLQIREKDPKKLSLIPVKYRTQPAFGRLQGTWQEWSLRAVSSSRVPSAAQSKLRKAINQK